MRARAPRASVRLGHKLPNDYLVINTSAHTRPIESLCSRGGGVNRFAYEWAGPHRDWFIESSESFNEFRVAAKLHRGCVAVAHMHATLFVIPILRACMLHARDASTNRCFAMTMIKRTGDGADDDDDADDTRK